MKEKWTKLGKSLICLALVTSMLAGCGGGGNSSSSSKEQTSGGTSGEVATGDDNFNETGLPIVKEPVELTFLYVKGANTMDFKDNAMFQQMEKDTNVKINWQYAGDADWSEQKSLLLASGDLPDVFFGDNALKDNDIATNLHSAGRLCGKVLPQHQGSLGGRAHYASDGYQSGRPYLYSAR